ncbi:MAG TPA: alcohol dehydrogenase catalytic domain-containing protein [Anaerolineae bacterium]|nr:alcohol dehydrogenase catalytic domain-containing protein [Anaerolineae bacterium]HQH37016.1 alcohol dehydrogenase catalytic domain-containing protein [Anaerolineae bacterium]
MRALVLDQGWHFVEDYPTPEPPPGEARIRVSMAGICNTDLELARGYMQFHGVAGHEFVGVVDRAPGAERWEGWRVVGDINAACGVCTTCRAGRPTHCPHRTTLGMSGRDGAFAEYLTLPIRNLYAVPDTLPDEVAVFTEPLAAAGEILEQVHIRPTDRVIVLGDGKLGLLCAQVLALTGCDLTVIGHHADKLSLLAGMGMATLLVPRGTTPEPAEIKGPADVVVEATGQPEGYAMACAWVRPRGTLVLKSTYHGTMETNPSRAVVDEVTLVGSRCGPFAPALRLLERGLIHVSALIQARYPFTEILTALRCAGQSGALKVLVKM